MNISAKKINFCFIIFLFSLIEIAAQSVTSTQNATGLVIGENFRIHPSNANQTESFITNHPNNQNILFASAYTIKTQPTFFISEGIYVSTDGGNIWFGTDTCKGEPISFHGGEPSITIDKNGTFIINRLGVQSIFPGLYSHFSNDNGVTWSAQKTITEDDMEKHSMISDNFSSSPNFGRVYASYALLSSPYTVKFTYSNDGGQNWVPVPSSINNPLAGTRSFETDIELSNNGDIYICWAVLPLAVPSPKEINIGFASSTNGGASWTAKENEIVTSGITGNFPEKQNIRVNSIPRIAVDNSNSLFSNNIYIVTTQKDLLPAGSDPDIILFRSTDKGLTWSPGIRVNQDQFNNGKTQFFPAITVDPGGGINILYFDDRNTTNDSSGVFLSRSTDGGNTWIDLQVSDHNYKPAAVSGLGSGNVADHIDITFNNGRLLPVWMDNSTGIYQVWTAPIELNLVSINDYNSNRPDNFKLKQNYPNPFNPNTIIEFDLSNSAYVSIIIYDVTGKEIITLFNGFKYAGNHRLIFETGKLNLSSGVYFYSLQSDGFSQTRPMLLLK
jgi:hypothetical protein